MIFRMEAPLGGVGVEGLEPFDQGIMSPLAPMTKLDYDDALTVLLHRACDLQLCTGRPFDVIDLVGGQNASRNYVSRT